MRTRVISAGVLAIAGLWSAHARASAAIDQELADPTAAVGALVLGGGSHQILAQAVTAAITGTLTRVDLPIVCSGSEGVILKIEGVASSGRPDDVALSTQIVAKEAFPPVYPAPPVFRAIQLETPVQVTAGSQFAIVVTSPGMCVWYRSAAGGYPGGDGWYRVDENVGWVVVNPALAFGWPSG